MNSLTTNKSLLSLHTLLALALFLATGPKWASAQNCGCAADLCCSKFGYCGTGDAYCGDGCQQGKCYNSNNNNNPQSSDNIVTDAFFNGIISQARSDCPGRGFYTPSAFRQAVGSYPEFGKTGTPDDSKREIAAFFAHVTHETGHFCYIEEINGASRDYCDKTNMAYPCVPDKGYYGRGPLQLSWNFNYGLAGQSIGFNGLNDPDVVSKDPVIAFKAALWFWMNNCHKRIVSEGFGSTIRAINSMECNGGNADTVTARVNYYTDYCGQLGVNPGDNTRC